MKIGIVGDVHLTETIPKSRNDVDYLETLLKKLDYIYSMCDIVIFLGDLFDKPSLSNQGLNRILEYFLVKFTQRKKSFLVMGNHDIPHLNPDSLVKSNLGTLNIIKLVKVVSGPLELGPINLNVIPMSAKIICPKAVDRPGVHILIGHSFFENGLDPDFSVTRDMVEFSGYDYVFLGHDHEPHEPLQFGDSVLYRIGSLCRNTSHNYQIKRVPQFFLFDVEGDQVTPLGLIEVPARPGIEVFRSEVINKPQQDNEFAFMISADCLMEKFSLIKDGEFSVTVLSLLQKIEADVEVIEYIRNIYKNMGMELK